MFGLQKKAKLAGGSAATSHCSIRHQFFEWQGAGNTKVGYALAAIMVPIKVLDRMPRCLSRFCTNRYELSHAIA